MPKQTITVQMDADKAAILRKLAVAVNMHLEAYCAWILGNHIERKADIDSKVER